MQPDATRTFLRHCLATVAYRGGKALRGAPDGFESFRIAEGTRSAGEILAHLGDLVDWALSMAEGRQAWRDSAALPWPEGVARFHESLQKLDAYLASDAPLQASAERLFQGPIADALTHVGQIATRRALAGAPVRGENYFKAPVAVGHVGQDQPAPLQEF